MLQQPLELKVDMLVLACGLEAKADADKQAARQAVLDKLGLSNKDERFRQVPIRVRP